MCPPISFDHHNIEINITKKPSLCTRLFTGDNQANAYTANGTRTVYISAFINCVLNIYCALINNTFKLFLKVHVNDYRIVTISFGSHLVILGYLKNR